MHTRGGKRNGWLGRAGVEAPPLTGVENKSSANIVRARAGNPE